MTTRSARNFTYTASSFVDRDMFMRHLGGGIGHLASSDRLATTESGVVDDPEDEEMTNALEDNPRTAPPSDEYLRQLASTAADDEEDAVCNDGLELSDVEEDEEDEVENVQ